LVTTVLHGLLERRQHKSIEADAAHWQDDKIGKRFTAALGWQFVIHESNLNA